MYLLLTSKGLNTEKIRNEFTRLLSKPLKKIQVQIFYSEIKVPNMDLQAYIEEDKNHLIKFGIQPQNIKTHELHQDNPPSLIQTDVIIMLGGNPFHYMNNIRKQGLELEIRTFIESGKVYVGRSAGAIIMSPDLVGSFFDMKNDVDLEDLSAFGFVDFYPVVHWDTKSGKKLSEIVKTSWEKDKQIICLTDQHAILATNKDFKII